MRVLPLYNLYVTLFLFPFVTLFGTFKVDQHDMVATHLPSLSPSTYLLFWWDISIIPVGLSHPFLRQTLTILSSWSSERDRIPKGVELTKSSLTMMSFVCEHLSQIEDSMISWYKSFPPIPLFLVSVYIP